MGKVVLGFPDFVQMPGAATVALSGGSWRAALPLSNLLRPEFAYLARSMNAATASTQFWVDLGVPRDVQVVAIPRANFSVAARVRVRGFVTQDAGGTVVADTGWRTIYARAYPIGALPWGHPSLWTGTLSPEDAAVFPPPFVAVFPTALVARYWLVEIDDASNPAGYFELPRIVLARGWQPSRNASYGASQVVEDLSNIQTSTGGADFADERPKRRVVRFTLGLLPDDEALVWKTDIQQRLGTTRQLLYCFDPDDAVNLGRRTFLARMRALSPLEFAVWGHSNSSYELIEVIA